MVYNIKADKFHCNSGLFDEKLHHVQNLRLVLANGLWVCGYTGDGFAVLVIRALVGVSGELPYSSWAISCIVKGPRGTIKQRKIRGSVEIT